MLRSSYLSRTSARRQLAASPTPAASEGARLLQCLIDELRSSLVLTGVTTSTLNALPRDANLLSFVAAFVPADPIIFPNLKAALIEGIDVNALDHVSHFYRYLPLAKLSLTTVLGDDDERTIRQVGDIWRTLCGRADLSIKEVDRYFRQRDADELHLSDDIRRLLVAARSGLSPTLRNGRPEVPAWFERRHQPRIHANLSAQLSVGALVAEVRIVNVSVGGCGLEQAPSLMPDVPVELRLESGRVLEAVVRWQNGTRAGLLFARPLHYRDPLISAG